LTFTVKSYYITKYLKNAEGRSMDEEQKQAWASIMQGFKEALEESKARTEESKARAEEAKARAEEWEKHFKAWAEESKVRAEEWDKRFKAQVEEAKARVEEAKARAEEAKARAEEWDKRFKAQVEEAKARAEEWDKRFKAQVEEAKARAEEADKRFKAQAEEAKARAEAQAEEAKRRAEEADKRFKEWEKRSAKLDAEIAEVSKAVGGISTSNGMLSEEMLHNSLADRMTFGGIKFDKIFHGWKLSQTLPDGKIVRGEFDITLLNGTALALIDVKYRARKDDIDFLIDKQLPKFRFLFPEYKNFKTYLGLGGMSFEKGVETAALQRGIGVIKVKGETVEINDTFLNLF
jgi:hypothetical protein